MLELARRDGDGGAGSWTDSHSDSDGNGDDRVANREHASVDVPASPAADPATPGQGPELRAAEPVDPAVYAGAPVMPSDGPELSDAETKMLF